MNIAIKPENINSQQTLAGKVSLVTGSTSGIGLGIGRARAAAGSEIVLNGFGKPEEVADVQAKIVADFKVRVSFSPADMSKPAAIREMIEKTLQHVKENNIPVERYEFQMLYGVRRDIQTKLRTDGYNVRVYVPFGSNWYPYLMRRMAERSSNVGFMARSFFKEMFAKK